MNRASRIKKTVGTFVMIALGCALTCAAGGAYAWAETVRLKNGNTLQGQVVRKTETELVVDLPGMGTMTFAMSDVAAIEEEQAAQEPFTHAVKLANENVLYGRVDEQNADHVSVTIPGTGVVAFPAAEVVSVEPLTAEKAAELTEELKKDQANKVQPAKAARSAAGKSSRSGGRNIVVDDEEDRIQREFAQRRQQAMAQVDQARQLVAKFQGGQSGVVPLPLAPSLAKGVSPEEMLRQKSPAAAMVLGVVLKAIAMLGIWLVVIVVAVMVYYAVCLQKIAERTGTDDEWMAWIPLVHIYLAIRVARMPGWWIILYFVPLVSIFVDVVVWMSIADARGKSRFLGLLTLLPVVNLIIVGVLAFGQDQPMIKPSAAV